MTATPTARTRRRGKELEDALLAAAWDELTDAGYGRFTMERVARRARTSEPVLYRRWPDKERLALASARHYRETHPVASPDTGSLRGDLIAYLTNAGAERADYFRVLAAAALSGFLAETSHSPSAVREEVIGTPTLSFLRPIYERAAARGEVDLARVSEAVLTLPFDLVRHDLLMSFRPLAPERIRTIVDDLFLPLVRRPES